VETGEKKMKIRFSQIFLVASIISLVVTVLWLIYPENNRRYHLVLTGMSRGRIHPFRARFKPYQGKKMGGAAGCAAVIKEEIASFSGAPFNILSLGSMISGTADAYFTRGDAVIQTMRAMGVEAMLPGNLEFTYGQQRLQELSDESGIIFISSNITESESGRAPSFISSEEIFNPGGGLKVGVLGISPPSTPNLTARKNIEGLEFFPPDEKLKDKVRALRTAGADLVVLLTMFSREHIKAAEWQPIASAAPDVCVMLDYELDAPAAIRRDGIIIKTVSGYNQSKEIDILDLELKMKPVRIVGFRGRRIAVNHAEIKPDPDTAILAERVTRQIRTVKDSVIGSFAEDHQRNYTEECVIGNFIADALRVETSADIALHNSGGTQNNIQMGDFTLGDLFSIMPFDNQIVTMTLSGRQIYELLELSASLQCGLLQISGGRYSFYNDGNSVHRLKDVFIGDEQLDPEKDYQVCTNNFLAEGGDNFTLFTSGRNIKFGRQQRDVVREKIEQLSQEGPIRLTPENRISREEHK